MLIDPFFISFKTAPSSEATTFSSITPNLIFLSMLLINAGVFTSLPAPKISSNVILNASVTEALPPMCPLANGNKLAEVTLRTWVAGDNTVLPN